MYLEDPLLTVRYGIPISSASVITTRAHRYISVTAGVKSDQATTASNRLAGLDVYLASAPFFAFHSNANRLGGISSQLPLHQPSWTSRSCSTYIRAKHGTEEQLLSCRETRCIRSVGHPSIRPSMILPIFTYLSRPFHHSTLLFSTNLYLTAF